MIKAIIIDDERLARNELKKLLLDYPEIEVVAEAANVGEGIEKIENLKDQLVRQNEIIEQYKVEVAVLEHEIKVIKDNAESLENRCFKRTRLEP